LLAYAIYFDHRRRTDPNFRKQLKRESRRQARAAKEEAEAHTIRQREAIKTAVAEAKEEGFPSDVEEKEAYFMNEVARGEQLSQDGMSSNVFVITSHITFGLRYSIAFPILHM
jgi:mitochondrial import receptor subunit TOM20